MRPKSRFIIIAVCLFIYFFLVFDINFFGPDEPVYFAYTESLVKDGDLNLVNQVYNDYGRFITATGNMPDFHDHAGVSLWAPFFIYGRVIHFLSEKLNWGYFSIFPEKLLAATAMSLSTIVFAFLTLLFTFFLCRRFFSGAEAFWSTAAIFLGTPFFYYSLFETGNGQIVASLLSVLCICALLYASEMKGMHWLIFGVFLSLSAAVKRELLPQALFIVPFIGLLVISGKLRLRNLVYFFLGLVVPFLLVAANLYLKYGSFHGSEVLHAGSLLFKRGSYAFDGIFNRFHGIFYTSPIILFCLAGMVPVVLNCLKDLRNKRINTDAWLLTFLSLYLIAKILLLGRVFSAAGDSLTTRLFINDIAILALLSGYCLRARLMPVRYLLYAIIILCVGWNMLTISEYMGGLDWLYIRKVPPLGIRLISLEYAAYVLLAMKDVIFKALFFLPAAICAVLSIFLALKFRKKLVELWSSDSGLFFLRGFSLLTLCILSSYLAITVLNAANNRRNAVGLESRGFFKYATAINASPMEINEYEGEENLWLLYKKEAYYAFNDDADLLIKTKASQTKEIGGSPRLRLHALPLRPYEELAEFYRNTGRFKEAISCYEKALLINPSDFESAISLGDIYSAVSQYEKAAFFYEKALSINPKIYMLYSSIGELYWKCADRRTAIDYFLKAIEKDPVSYKAYLNLADLYKESGEPGKAIELYKKVIRIWPDLPAPYAGIAALFKEAGDLSLAITNYNKYLSLSPASASAYLNLAEAYRGVGETAKSMESYQKSIRISPRFIEAYTQLASLYEEENKFGEAAGCYLKAVELSPGSPEPYNNLAQIYSKTGDNAKAVEYYRKYLELNPRSAEIYKNLADAYGKLNDYPRQIEALNNAIALNPKYAELYRLLADIYGNSNDNAKAVEYYRKYLELNPRSAEIYKNLADAYGKLNDYPRQIEALNNAIALNPKYAELYRLLADIYRNGADYPTAVKYYQKVIQISPGNSDAYDQLASLYRESGEYDKAAECYQQVLKNNPGSAQAYKNLGEIYLKDGVYAKSIEYFEKYIKLNPRSSDVYNSLADAYRNTGEIEKAIGAYKQVISLNPDDPWVYFDLGQTYATAGDTENVLKQVSVLKALKRRDLAQQLEGSLRK